MHRTALLAVALCALALAACGEKRTVSEVEEVPATQGRLFIQVAGMVKALGIT